MIQKTNNAVILQRNGTPYWILIELFSQTGIEIEN